MIFKFLPASCPDQSIRVRPGTECHVGRFSVWRCLVTDAGVGFLSEKKETNCLYLHSIAVIKTMTKNQRGEERVDLAYSSKLQFIIEGSQERT